MSDDISKLKINEIFYSLQGEATHMGLPCVFVRLTGCNLRCTYCDSEYSFYEGDEKTFEEVLQVVRGYGCDLIQVTGGEPMQQPLVVPFCQILIDEGYDVLIETSGSYDISVLPPAVKVILDVKTPASRMERFNIWENINYLNASSDVKFVICNKEDYDWSKKVLAERFDDFPGKIFFSPVTETLPARKLAEWICKDVLPVRMQLQLHRIVWGEEPEGSKGSTGCGN